MSPQATSEPSAPTPARRRRLLRPAGVGATVAVFVALAAVYSGGLSLPVGITGAFTGALVAGGFFAFRALSGPLGRATTVAAFSLSVATILGAWAALSPTCPGASGGGRCTTTEAGTWALSGVIYPLAYLAVLGVPLLGASALRTGARKVRNLLRRGRAKVKARRSGRP